MSEELHNLFFIKEEQIQNCKVILTGPEFHHIKNVLRKRSGETVHFTDGKGNQYKTAIEQTLHNAMIMKLLEKKHIVNEKSVNLDLGLVSLKTGRTDLIIEKGTELGIHKFIFFVSQHAIIRNLNIPRIEHFKKIALSAMLQSQQYYLPEIVLVDDIIKEFANYDFVVVGDKDGNDKIILGVMNVLLLFGPENSFFTPGNINFSQ